MRKAESQQTWIVRSPLVALVCTICASPVWASGIDFIVFSASDDGGQLALAKPALVDEPYPIRPADIEELPGYFLTIEPGWDGLGEDQPDEGRSALEHAEGILLERVSFDAGFSVYDLDFNPLLEVDGDTILLAGEPEADGFAWHEHIVFGVEPGTELGAIVEATFRLIDPEEAHEASEPFAVTFVTAEAVQAQSAAPSSGLCGLIGMLSPVLLLLMLGWFKSRLMTP